MIQMKIRIMKQVVLDKIKDNIDDYIKNYFLEETNEWMWAVCECEPFEDFKEIDDFKLADINQQPTMIDYYNCQILYSKLNFLDESQASDERLWAGLCNDVFYSYLKKRFNINKDNFEDTKNPSGKVLTRFFYKNSGRSGYFRNSLAKCWWVGHHTYDPINKFKLLETLGSNDMSTKITDIFHNYTFTSCPNVLSGIIEGIGYFNSNGINYNVKDDVRPCLQYINAIGGSIVLDVLTSNDIRNIFIEQIKTKLDGKSNGLVHENYISDLNDDEPNCFDESAIMVGDQVQITDLTSAETKKFKIKYKTDFKLYPIQECCLGKHEGDTFICNGKKYQIDIVFKGY